MLDFEEKKETRLGVGFTYVIFKLSLQTSSLQTPDFFSAVSPNESRRKEGQLF